MDSRIGQTSTTSPAEPGGLPTDYTYKPASERLDAGLWRDSQPSKLSSNNSSRRLHTSKIDPEVDLDLPRLAR
jgi:hypothetical protein